MRLSQSAQLKALQNLHDKQVDEIKHRTEELLREKRKRLDKSTGDKEELNRSVLLENVPALSITSIVLEPLYSIRFLTDFIQPFDYDEFQEKTRDQQTDSGGRHQGETATNRYP